MGIRLWTAAVWMMAGGLAWAGGEVGASVFPGKALGRAEVRREANRIALANQALSATFTVAENRLLPGVIEDRLSGRTLPAPEELFSLVFRDGHVLDASAMRLTGAVADAPLVADVAATRTAERYPGRQLSATLESKDGALRVAWRAMLRDEANYIRIEIAVAPVRGDADIAQVLLVDQQLPKADVAGQVAGSPIVDGTFFTGLEHPMSVSRVRAGAGGDVRLVPAPVEKGKAECEDDPLPGDIVPLREGAGNHHASCWLERALPIRQGSTCVCSSVLGVTPAGQLRRGFLYYVERERAHPYRPFLHYNSWYDIGYFAPYDEQDCLAVIRAFGEELCRKRGVKMDSFLFDDGWDDPSKGGEWGFHSGFPKGFAPVSEAAASYGAAPGVWLSPWGGYGDPRVKRVKSGRAAGYEAAGEGYETLFALSGPKYYENFHKVCSEMVTRYGINQFKLDGTGNIDSVVPGSRFGSDFEAAIALIGDLRRLNPGLFINLTTGTWPSPFWLTICDSIWRGGEDHSFKGVGSARQRWITYRDSDTYERLVRGRPLYPLNSLMLHGILYARKAHKLETDPENDFRSEVRSYFGSGTQLQEMYISHELLTETNWNVLAESAAWSRTNAATLLDTHWVGGDPGKLEVYGWAAWSPAKGILTLRNPNDVARDFTVDLRAFFELPQGMPTACKVVSPYGQKLPEALGGAKDMSLPVKISVRPFEVLVVEVLPAS
jgi:hypothetical protein